MPMTSEELVSVVDGSVTLTDGGLETTLIYHRGLDLPEFAAFPLLDREEGRDELRAYFEPFLALAAERGPWVERVRGVRANASRMSHEELDAAGELDAGDPVDFGASNAELRSALPNVSVLGGCCGTDDRHIAELRDAWLAATP